MADPFATTADIENAWRALTAEETNVAEFWLEFASEVIRAEVPDIDDRIASGDLSAVVARGVTVAMVLRRLQNPEGFRSVQQAIEDYSETKTRDSALSAGGVYLSEEELCLLRGRGSGAFSITPYSPPSTYDVLSRVAQRRAEREGVCWP